MLQPEKSSNRLFSRYNPNIIRREFTILRFTKCSLLKPKQSQFFGNISKSYTVYTVWSRDRKVVVGMLMKRRAFFALSNVLVMCHNFDAIIATIRWVTFIPTKELNFMEIFLLKINMETIVWYINPVMFGGEQQHSL